MKMVMEDEIKNFKITDNNLMITTEIEGQKLIKNKNF